MKNKNIFSIKPMYVSEQDADCAAAEFMIQDIKSH